MSGSLALPHFLIWGLKISLSKIIISFFTYIWDIICWRVISWEKKMKHINLIWPRKSISYHLNPGDHLNEKPGHGHVERGSATSSSISKWENRKNSRPVSAPDESQLIAAVRGLPATPGRISIYESILLFRLLSCAWLFANLWTAAGQASHLPEFAQTHVHCIAD